MREEVLCILAAFAAATLPEQVAVFPAVSRQRHLLLPQVVHARGRAVATDDDAGLQMPLLVDRNHERLQLGAGLLGPGEFHALEQAELELVGFQALGQVVDIAPQDQLAGDSRLRFHQGSERFQDNLNNGLGRVARQTAREADADRFDAFDGFFAACYRGDEPSEQECCRHPDVEAPDHGKNS